MKQLLRFTVVVIASFALVFTCFIVFIHFAFDDFFSETPYSRQELIDHYEENKTEILDLKNYFESIVPADAKVAIEFDDDALTIFHVDRYGIHGNHWDVTIGSKQCDSLVNILGWINNELATLHEKLEDAGCISIESRKPVTIGYQRSGMGIYSYVVFDEKPNDSLMKQYNDGRTYIYYKDNVAFEYGGGAVGPQYFPKNY